MARTLNTTLLAAALVLVSSFPLLSQTPRTISYQGVLADQSGTFLPDGIHAISISLYDAPTGGSALFTETASVTVVRGVFNVILGAAGGGIPESVPFDRAYFLGVSVDGGIELQPRTPMTAVPYALRASVADHATTADQAQALAPGATGAVTSVNGASGAITIQGTGGTSVTNSGGVITIEGSSGAGGEAGGDLTGTYPNPTIAPGAVSGNKIADQGVGFSKISRSGADAGEVLGFDGSNVSWRKDGLQLPFSAVTKATGSAIEIIDSATFSSSGSGPLLRLDLRDTTSTRLALRITSNSHGVNAIDASTTGGGSAAIFSKSKDRATGGGGTFIGPVIVAESRSGSQVTAAEFNALDTANTRPAVDIQHRGKGVGLQVDATGANIATFRRRRVTGQGASSTSTVVRFDSTGKGFFDGGTQNGGADLAEAFDVEGDRATYVPGDVLVISTERDRQVVRSSQPYSTLVAGVYATKPGVLLTEGANGEDLSQMVPMGVIGVIPTKVSGENGAIRIGDLLVTSSIPGHAMKGDPAIAKEHPGCVIGKALDNYDGSGTGMIRVLVNVR